MTVEQRTRSLGRRISKIYEQAEKELAEKVDSFFADFERLDKKQSALVNAGKLSEEEYKKWRKNKLLMGEKYKQLRDNVGQTMLKANETAAAIINRELIPTYATGYNFEGKKAEDAISGYSFDLIDEDAVKRLTTSNKTILPYKVVNGKRDVRWNTKHVNSAILQGIIQGESIPKISKRLEAIAGMNEDSARRNARTAVTGAHNSGRQDCMHKLSKDGVIVQKEWLATTGDSRTRDAHLELHHVVVDEDQPFENSIGRIMFPRDPNANPANVYNCRCSVVSVIKSFQKWKNSKEIHDDIDFEAEETEAPSLPKYQNEMAEKGYVGLSGEESDKFMEEHHNKKIIGKKGENTMDGGQSRRINEALRKGEMPSNPKDVAMVEKLDKAISKNELPSDMTLFRGVSNDAFKSTGVLDGFKKTVVDMQSFKDGHGNIDFDAFGKAIGKATREDNEDLLARAKKLVGMELKDDGFMQVSASSERNIFASSPFNLQIHAKKGTNAYISDYLSESEIILGRSSTIRIVDAEISKVTLGNGAVVENIQLIAELIN